MAQPGPVLPNAASYDALLSYITEAVLLLDTDGVMRYASPSSDSVLGVAPTALLGTPFLTRIHADDHAAMQRALSDVLAQPKISRTVSYRSWHADRSWRILEATLTNRLSDPLLRGIIVVGRDQTAQREVQARSEGAAEAATARWQALQSVTDAALAHLDLADLSRHVLDRVTAALGVDNTAILLLDEERQELRLYVARGPEEAVAGQVRVPFGQGVAGRIAATQAPLIVDDMARANPANPFLREHIRSLLGVPLRVNSRVIGVLHVGTLVPHHFTQEDLHWLQLVADRVALAIDHARLYEAERAGRALATIQAQELEAIFEAIGDALFVYDAAGHLLRANTAAHTLNRLLDEPEYQAQPFAARAALATPRDAAGRPVSPDEVPVARVLRGDQFIGADAVDSLVHMPDGRDVLLNVTGAPIHDAQGHIVGGVIVTRDVTERRQLEQRTHDALETLLAMAQTLLAPPTANEEATMSQTRSLHRVGQRLVELTRPVLGCQRVGLVAFDQQAGVQRAVAVAGLSPELEQAWWDSVDGALLADPQAPTDPELVARFMAGEIVLVDMTQPPFQDQPNPFGIRVALAAPLRVNGATIGVLSLDYGGAEHTYTPEEMALADAVAQLAALALERERLLRAQADAQATELALREVNRRMDEFLSIATHELRSPLTSIQGNLQLLHRRLRRLRTSADADTGAGASRVEGAGAVEGGRTAQQVTGASLEDLVQRATEQTSRLTRMMTALLDVSRIQSGHLELHREACDLVGLVRQCVEELRLAWPGRTLTLEVPAEAMTVQADADRLGQVITNFVTNALKYSAPERPVVVRVQREDTMARVLVRDEGPGLTQEQQANIWERYRRVPGVAVQDDTQAAGGSLGLGLYISRSIMMQHDGAIGVESTPGVGSTFWCALPLDLPRA